MKTVDFNYLKETLGLAIDFRLVAQAWLGYAEALFLGIGDEVTPAVGKGEAHPDPPYELQTNFSLWSVEDEAGVIGTSEDVRDKASSAIQQLVGKRIAMWHLIEDSLSLVIYYDGGLALKISPMMMKTS